MTFNDRGLVLADSLDIFFRSLLFTLPLVGLTPPGLRTKIPVGQISVGEQQTVDQNTRQIHTVGSPWMCDKCNIRATARYNTEQTQRTHTQSQDTIDIKTSDHAGNHTRADAAGWKARTLPAMPWRRTHYFFMHFEWSTFIAKWRLKMVDLVWAIAETVLFHPSTNVEQ